MNKRYISILCSLLAVVMGTSCDQLLTEEPKDYQTTVGNFFDDYADLEQTITAAYNKVAGKKALRHHAARTLFIGADDWTALSAGNKTSWANSDKLNISSSNGDVAYAGWEMPYGVILQTNFAIEGKEKLISAGVDESKVTTKVAEAYFLRGWAYFWLVRLYGGVPIVLQSAYSDENANMKRNSVEEVYAQILSDLAFAIQHLPESQPQVGQVSKWAATALRAKVYLTMASWPLKQVQHYADALNDANDVITNGGFALQPSFANVFDFSIENDNSEYIWQLTLCKDCPVGLFNTFAARSTTPNIIGGWEDMFIEKAFFDKFPEGPRKDFTFMSNFTYLDGENEVTYNVYEEGGETHDVSKKHAFLSKFYGDQVNKSGVISGGVNHKASDQDVPMIRLAEMYLIYAEAHLMGGGGDKATALAYFNEIHNRGTGSTIDEADLTFDAVIDERAWEFTGEMKRWFDLTRTEKLKEALIDENKRTIRSDESGDFDDNNELLLIGDPANQNLYYHPIPILDIQKNPNLTQNPR